MKTLFLDIFSGISGDMFLGAMVDLGLEPVELERELAKLKLNGYHLHVSRQERGKIAGTKFDVHVEESGCSTCAEGHSHAEAHSSHAHGHEPVHGQAESHAHPHEHAQRGAHPRDHDHDHDHPHDSSHDQDHREGHGRNYAEIRLLINKSGLSGWVKEKASAVFHRIAVAEGKIHGQPPEKVHFHEVGAVDSIVDIVGACIALELLGRPRVLAGGVVEGVGSVTCAHGRFPLPAPATLEILSARRVTIQQTDEPNELITPTGAALLAEFAESFGPMGGLEVTRIGYGLGGRENRTRPNVLRAVLGESSETSTHDWERDEIVRLETNLDDVTAEILGAFLEKALLTGALDVFHTPIQMKKNRPGVLLSVLCSPADADRFTDLLFRETTAFGVRRMVMERRKLRREMRVAKTSLGEIDVKLGWLDGKIIQVAPEFESCRRAAAQNQVALWEVYEAARRAFV